MALNKIAKEMLDFVPVTNQDLKQGNLTGSLNVLQYDAKGDGNNNDTNPILNALAATSGKIKEIFIPDGTYLIDKTIIVPRNVHLKLSQNAIIKPITGNFNIFQLKPQSTLTGGVIDLQGVTFTKAVFYFDADDVFQFYGQSHKLSDINILASNPGNGNFTGTGILMEAKAPGSNPMPFIDNVKCNNLTFINLEKVIHLRVDPAWDAAYKADNNKMAWINANYFHQITAQNFKYAVYLEGTSTVPRDVCGNYFTQCQFQSEPTTETVVYCESGYNFFDAFLWDVHKMATNKPAMHFTKSAKFNRIVSATTLEMTRNWRNDGYQNDIDSPGNYTTSKAVAHNISMPYKANFYGNQDDYLVNGHKRGYILKQTKGVAPVGTLTDMLVADTEYGCTWDMTGTTYDNPIVLEMDTVSDPIWYMQYLGTASPYGKMPEGMLMEGYDATTNQWVWLHEFNGNKSSAVNIAPPYSAIDKCTKFRISFYRAVSADNRVVISRIFATSAKDGGKMYQKEFTDKLTMTDIEGNPHTLTISTDGKLGTVGVSNVVDGSLPPVQSGNAQMIGDQDDILANLHLWGTASFNVNTPKVAGEHYNMWDIRDEKFVSYNNPTVDVPLIIEMDFGTNPLPYVESLGIAMQWGESAKNVKFEVVNSAGGSYVTAKNITNNADDIVQVKYRSTSIYKIKITLSGVNNTTTNRIKIGRCIATSGMAEPQAFMPRHGGKMYGDIEFNANGIIMKSPDGSRWRMGVSNEGTTTWTKL